jgi:rhodanese-related sulfurtransferase
MQRFLWLILLVWIFVFAACGGQAAPVVTTDGEIDLASLPPLIDVHTAHQLQDRAEVLFVDVREQGEFDAGHIPGITLIPMSEIQNRLAEIPKDKTVVVSCQSGGRSSQVAKLLHEQGFANIHDLQGGFAAWQQAGLPVE